VGVDRSIYDTVYGDQVRNVDSGREKERGAERERNTNSVEYTTLRIAVLPELLLVTVYCPSSMCFSWIGDEIRDKNKDKQALSQQHSFFMNGD